MQVVIDGVLYVPAVQQAVPDTAQRIRDAIAQLRKQNIAWPDVQMYLQTWTLQRGLSPEEWEVAYAAGMPRPVAPTDAPPASGDGPFDPYAPIIDWNRGVAGSALVYKVHAGGGEKMIYVPEGWVGNFVLEVTDDPESKGSDGYDTTLNGAHPYHAANGNNEPTHIVYVGVVPPADNNPRNVVGGTGPYTYSVRCQGEAAIALRHYP